MLIDEQAGREVARQLGLRFSGVAGQLLRAVREQVATPEEALSRLTELRVAGRINRHVYQAVAGAINADF